MHPPQYWNHLRAVSVLSFSLLYITSFAGAVSLEDRPLDFPNIDPAKSHCNINGSLSATDSAVFTSTFVKNRTVPLAWVLGVAAHQDDRDTVGVSRTFYFGPQKNDSVDGSATVQGCALIFPSASQHYNTSNPYQAPADAKLPARCLADMKELVQRAARNESAQFARDPTGACGQIAEELVVTNLESCFGYNIQNVQPRPLSPFDTFKNMTENDLLCQPSTTPKFDLTLIEDNSVVNSKDEFGLASMINYSTPIITVIYPSSVPSNGTVLDPEIHYTALKPANYEPLLDLVQTSQASGLIISSLVFIGGLVHMAFMFL